MILVGVLIWRLSILFMRFQFIVYLPFKLHESFNSLYEIHTKRTRISVQANSLSILFMRFKIVQKTAQKTYKITFNSLYEIQKRDSRQIQQPTTTLSILFMRFQYLSSMFSLTSTYTFNSLYEIPVHLAVAEEMLFRVLSILFMRFGLRTEMNALLDVISTFNSLYEILIYWIKVIGPAGFIFQFSL